MVHSLQHNVFPSLRYDSAVVLTHVSIVDFRSYALHFHWCSLVHRFHVSGIDLLFGKRFWSLLRCRIDSLNCIVVLCGCVFHYLYHRSSFTERSLRLSRGVTGPTRRSVMPMDHNFSLLIRLHFLFQLLLRFPSKFSFHWNQSLFSFDSIDDDISLTRSATTVSTILPGTIDFSFIHVHVIFSLRMLDPSSSRCGSSLCLRFTAAPTHEEPERIIIFFLA